MVGKLKIYDYKCMKEEIESGLKTQYYIICGARGNTREITPEDYLYMIERARFKQYEKNVDSEFNVFKHFKWM